MINIAIFSSSCGGKGDGTLFGKDTPTPTVTPVPVMSNILVLMGVSADAADEILGKPYKVFEAPTQTDPVIIPQNGYGDSRYYDYGDYEISLLFEKQQQISTIVIIQGLVVEEYTLDDASALLEKLGLLVTSPSDVASDRGVSWYNVDGYEIYAALGHIIGEYQYERGGTYLNDLVICKLP